MLPKEERDVIRIAGRYTYYKMKDLGLPINMQSYNEYLDKQNRQKRLKKKMGKARYEKMKELNLSYKEFIQHEKEQKLKRYEKRREKDRIRFKTIRYIERYCNLELKCQICGQKAEIHHPNYKDYLKVNLLCKRHHTALHNFELVPPEIIDLEVVAIKKPKFKNIQITIEENINNIKDDILLKEFSLRELSEKYKISREVICRQLKGYKDWDILKKILDENGKKKFLMCTLKYPDNLIQKYRIEHKLSAKDFSQMTGIALSTIRAIESGKTDIKKVRTETRYKLEKVLNIN